MFIWFKISFVPQIFSQILRDILASDNIDGSN